MKDGAMVAEINSDLFNLTDSPVLFNTLKAIRATRSINVSTPVPPANTTLTPLSE